MKKQTLIFTLLCLTPFSTQALDWRGSVGIESRYFTQHEDFQTSVFIEPEIYWENDSGHAVNFKSFARYEQQDDERSHADIRELFYQYASDNLEIKAGFNKVFWGVTESQHLVDIINQTDNLEGVDGEDKLGQPMLQLTFVRDWGVIDVFALPYFRERKFAGQDGHFNLTFEAGQQIYQADLRDAAYESDDEEHHLDTALRYSHNLGDWDFGLSYFTGTQRDPLWLIGAINSAESSIQLTPYYLQIEQWGLDLQATLGAWLWKTEIISRETLNQQLTAATAGVEYTFYGVSESGADFGVLMEFSKNDSPELAPSILQNTIFLGGRHTWNDEQSSEFLMGISHNLDNQSYAAKIEASRRLGNNYKLSLDAWFFDADDQEDLLYRIRNDDFLQLSLEYYF